MTKRTPPYSPEVRERAAEKLLRYDLVVIDELGYLQFSQAGGQLLST